MWLRNVLLAGFLLVASNAQAQSLCVFSLVGAHGELWEFMTDYRLAAARQGAHFDLRVFTDERVAGEDLKAGMCDGLLMSGIKARQFVPFSGSIDSIGGLHSYDALQALITLTAHPQLAASMRNGAWETAGVMPLGAAYLFLKDRRITSVDKIAGKRIAVFDNDRAQMLMSEYMGLRPVLSDVTNFSSKFNNGVVDIIAAPAVAYLPLELYRGVGSHGLVVKMPAAQLTMQLVLRREHFDESFMQWSRQFFLENFDLAMRVVEAAEDDILFFYPPPDRDRERYIQLMNDARRYLISKNVYDEDMMRWLKKVRCKVSPERAECGNGSPW
ncbi:MAG: hypothetical protein KBT87_06785 [Gammaproteobacteria bacterium]|jgi:hypothetical protein|nr:hypothetical protein [Gammaproteobacteria bacterium]MBQ0774358.1 hypothetical protein [Gammaproteobacteria bacterium]